MTSLYMTADTLGLHKISEWLKKLTDYLNHRKSVNKTVLELSKLSDKQLKDIGLTRSEIYSVAEGTYYMKGY